MSDCQKWPGPLGFGIVFYDDFDIDFWASWGRFGLRLGGHFRSFWRLGRPKLVSRPSSNRLNIEKVNFSKNEPRVGHSTILRSKSAQDGTQDGPRSTQDGSKIVLDRFFHLLIFRFDF